VLILIYTDPKTQAWLKESIEPTFGYPSLVRFSWTTVKVLLDKQGHEVKWYVFNFHSDFNIAYARCAGSTKGKHHSLRLSRVLRVWTKIDVLLREISRSGMLLLCNDFGLYYLWDFAFCTIEYCDRQVSYGQSHMVHTRYSLNQLTVWTRDPSNPFFTFSIDKFPREAKPWHVPS
jgi:hypothetical protein